MRVNPVISQVARQYISESGALEMLDIGDFPCQCVAF